MDIYDSSSYHDLVIRSSSEDVASRTLAVTRRATFINKDIGNLSSAGLRGDRVRIIGFIKRKPGISLEEFQRHWGDIHSKVYTNLGIVKRNIIRYEQVRMSSPLLFPISHEYIAVSHRLYEDERNLPTPGMLFTGLVL